MKKLFFALFLLLHHQLVLAATTAGQWHAGIGDPTVFGWLTVLVYLVAVKRCNAKVKELKFLGGDYQFWLYLGTFLFLLGINKQLDLQSWFTEVMRDRAKTYGWYQYRKSLQIAFLLSMSLGTLTALISLRLFLANSWWRYKITLLGIMLLCAFILMRTASFHHFDLFIGHKILGLTVNVLLENGALLLIIWGTYLVKKLASPLVAHAVDFIEIAELGGGCPQCSVQSLSKPKDGRLFKCRSCGHKYMVRIAND